MKLVQFNEMNRNATLQAETMGMMTKYQLVFVKMETAFGSILNSNKIRDLKKKQQAFCKFRDNVIS